MANRKIYTQYDFLYDRYVKQKKTIDQIAKECEEMGVSVTSMTIYNHLKAHNLIKNSRNLGSRKSTRKSSGSSSKRKYY